MNLSFFLARKIEGSDNAARNVSKPAIRIATLGVAIGLAVILVSVAVVLGFKHTIRDKVVGFGSHIVVANFMTLQSSHPEPIEMTDSMLKVLRGIEGVKHVQRYAYTQGIIKTETDFLGVMFKGVDETFDTTFIASNLIEGEMPHFSREKSGNRILVSKIIADKLGLKAGEKVYAYFLSNDDVRMRRYTVAGIYQTNLTRYDEAICFNDLYSVVKLNGWEENQVSGAEVTVDEYDKLDATEDIIIDKVNRTHDAQGATYCSSTVRDQNPQLFSWLDLLDLNVWIILALMLSVAGFTIVSGLLIIILERTKMIGVLKALGARNSLVRHTFMWHALFVVGKGMVWGNVLGLGICLIQHYTGIITLDPTTYYVKHVPVELSLPLWALINVCTIVVCTLVLILPSYYVSTIHPARSMRYE